MFSRKFEQILTSSSTLRCNYVVIYVVIYWRLCKFVIRQKQGGLNEIAPRLLNIYNKYLFNFRYSLYFLNLNFA